MDHVVNLGSLIGSPPLSREREIALACAARRGDASARDALVRASLRLVALRVFALDIAPELRDDAFQSGVLGLIAAVDRFDPDREVRLATYAWTWITAAIRSGVSEPGLPLPMVEDSVGDPVDQDLCSDLSFLLSGLPSLVAEVMRLRFGFGDGTGDVRSRVTVAARLGLTIGEVRSVEVNTLTSLRRGLARLGHRAPGSPGADPL
jgi:DNA-directed RNA polymerase sigma subunit (sigma70/sigma32)